MPRPICWSGGCARLVAAGALLLLLGILCSEGALTLWRASGSVGAPVSQQRSELRAAAVAVWQDTERVLRAVHGAGDDAAEKRARAVQRRAHRLASFVAAKAPALRAALRPRTDYEADYDVAHPLLAPPELYGYGENPAFLYPEDVPGGTYAQTPHQLVSYLPRAYYFPNFLSADEAAAVVAAARPRLERSEVAVFKTRPDGESAEEQSADGVHEARTSSGAWLPESALTKKVKARVAGLTGLDPELFEQVQVLRYEKGQMYASHHDYFDPLLYGPQDSQRVATLYTFLSDECTGGEFSLPRANAGPHPVSFDTCTQGLRLKPRRGAALLFYGMRPDRVLDLYSLHTGCRVESGEKWGMVLWMHVLGESFSGGERL